MGIRFFKPEKGPEKIGDILSKLFVAKGWGRKQERLKLEKSWAEAAGETAPPRRARPRSSRSVEPAPPANGRPSAWHRRAGGSMAAVPSPESLGETARGSAAVAPRRPARPPRERTPPPFQAAQPGSPAIGRAPDTARPAAPPR